MNSIQFIFASTLFSAAFIVICIYFDKHRHEDPLFRKKLKLRRRKPLPTYSGTSLKPSVILQTDKESKIVQEIQSAEAFMTVEDYQNAVVHFANAIACCVDPYDLLISLNRSLPNEVYVTLVERLQNNFADQVQKLKHNDQMKTLLDVSSVCELYVKNKTS
ncbi:mitochondrial import receptor subunit TOM20 homolog B-like [Photinus pyralis]|uniref:mitochondrial import receptor subunit TOM20 homolog B-like n=1 Tax=Photinus pyralis TaxID=7054 RepID=UPI0012676273|nr:mitochondrial import receptor subunit TOM20 homolog B-like [Photinus pyralis]